MIGTDISTKDPSQMEAFSLEVNRLTTEACTWANTIDETNSTVKAQLELVTEIFLHKYFKPTQENGYEELIKDYLDEKTISEKAEISIPLGDGTPITSMVNSFLAKLQEHEAPYIQTLKVRCTLIDNQERWGPTLEFQSL